MSEIAIDANNVANWLEEKCNSENYELSENEVENLINLFERNEFPLDAFKIFLQLLGKPQNNYKYIEILFNIPPEQILRYQDYIDFDKEVPKKIGFCLNYKPFAFFWLIFINTRMNLKLSVYFQKNLLLGNV